MRCVCVCNPEGKRRSVAVTDEEARAYLAVETQRPWADRAIVWTMPVGMALCSTMAVLTLPWIHDGQLPAPATTWYHRVEPPFAVYVALVRQHRWRRRLVVNSAAA
jgi:hypothetical protein